MYELCYLGIPTFVIPQNDHQGEFATELANKGIVTLIGSLSHNQQKKIKLITQVMNNKKLGLRKTSFKQLLMQTVIQNIRKSHRFASLNLITICLIRNINKNKNSINYESSYNGRWNGY